MAPLNYFSLIRSMLTVDFLFMLFPHVCLKYEIFILRLKNWISTNSASSINLEKLITTMK